MARRQAPGVGDKPSTNFNNTGATTPYVAQAAKYLQQRRAKVGLPKAEMPVAGGLPPRIPALHGQVDESSAPMPMASHAELTRAGRDAAAGAIGGPPVAAPVSGGPGVGSLDIRPSDTLPEAATRDPQFTQGTGAMMASNQPLMAQRYGVVRDGQFVSPQQLELRPMGNSPQQQLSPQTVAGLTEIANAQAAKGQAPTPAVKAATGAPAKKSEGDVKAEEEEEELEKEIKKIDEFQLQKLKDAMSQNALNNPEQKRIIESRLKPMTIDDLITKGYVEQRIPIRPDKFELILRSTEGDVDIGIKRLVMEQAQALEVSDQYWLDLYSYYSAVTGLHGINSRTFPDYRDAEGKFSAELFLVKFEQVIRLPLHILASVGCNIVWFEARVRELCTAVEVGNG